MGIRVTRAALLLILLGMVIFGGAMALSAAGADTESGGNAYGKVDNEPDPLSAKQFALKQVALERKLGGSKYGKVAQIAKGQYVELAREGEDSVLTMLSEFSDLEHNTIQEPDRSADNTTIWRMDFNTDYYKNLLFGGTKGTNSLRNYLIEQSSNRYTVNGDVTNWVQVPGTAASYDDDLGSDAVSQFLKDSAGAWYASRIAAGKTPAEIDAYLAQFDVRDRFDYDGDGNFNEPDGYIDVFQSVHAGVDEVPEGPAWAIASGSSYAYKNLMMIDGPVFNPMGGFRLGNSSYWVGKYMICAENSGVGTFAHEWAHDVGLPNLQDRYGYNGTGFWTLMSEGRWLDEGASTIGNKPGHMGAWEKFQLGWLNYQVGWASTRSSHSIAPAEYNTKSAQGVFIVLPKKPVTVHSFDPYAGSYFYYSGSANNIDSRMYKHFDLPAGATLSAKVNFEIEPGADYASLILSTDGGATWQTVPTNLSNSSLEPNSIEGGSPGWVDLTADLSAWQGHVYLGFRYVTDGAVVMKGFAVDDINITGYPTDGAETDTGWSNSGYYGFRRTTGSEDRLFSHYYVLENRTYMGYDSTLRTGPYFFGYRDDPVRAGVVDHFQYQDGLLISYWDTSQVDNNTTLHPGRGLLLPIDAHFSALYRVDGVLWNNNVQTYDSTFGLQSTDGIPGIHVNSVLSPVPSLPAASVFDDRKLYYDPANPRGSVMNPNTGTIVKISGVNSSSFIQVQVAPAK